jgi:short-subunit dehydrogenase
LFDNIPEGEAAILVNNVGMGLPRTTIFETKPQDIEDIIKTNIFS